ncbi:MAG: fibronectin type III domain-containing protein [Thiocapsa sp.]|uniref:fibronectin type III domain-containing protein n=1 Tax=Thiocapsa sp. TaxID=2024551 RepID=UPI001BCE5BEB|nr:fibronectin type III domain-containing protein [Thiocapsa sp.]QVL48494.1 MAG: fibronectin type III domain-containing protein [Thiocapsa sp.]
MSIARSHFCARVRSRLEQLFIAFVGMLAFTGNALAGSATLAWNGVSAASGYLVYYGTASREYTQILDARANTRVTVSGLTDGVRYYYAVRAYRGADTSDYSQEVSGTVGSSDDITAPAAPSSLASLGASASRVNLVWRDNSNNESGFRIERRIGTGAWSQIGSVGANVITFASTGLRSSTTYNYRVRAHNGSGTSAYSNTVAVRTAAPAAPSNLAASVASRSRIDLRWRDNSNNETGFRIERRIGTGAWSQIATVGPNVTGFASTGLRSRTTYGYRVRAYNGIGTSAYSNVVSATTR